MGGDHPRRRMWGQRPGQPDASLSARRARAVRAGLGYVPSGERGRRSGPGRADGVRPHRSRGTRGPAPAAGHRAQARQARADRAPAHPSRGRGDRREEPTAGRDPPGRGGRRGASQVLPCPRRGQGRGIRARRGGGASRAPDPGPPRTSSGSAERGCGSRKIRPGARRDRRARRWRTQRSGARSDRQGRHRLGEAPGARVRRPCPVPPGAEDGARRGARSRARRGGLGRARGGRSGPRSSCPT